MSTRRLRFWRHDAGQSLVEFGLVLPLLLIAFIGVADVGRLFFYTSMISSAAREGAIYAANHSAALPDCRPVPVVGSNPPVWTHPAECAPLSSGPVLQQVCDASGATNRGASCPTEVKVASATYGSGLDAMVEVTYDFSFIITSLGSRLIPSDTLTLRASSTFAYRQ